VTSKITGKAHEKNAAQHLSFDTGPLALYYPRVDIHYPWFAYPRRAKYKNIKIAGLEKRTPRFGFLTLTPQTFFVVFFFALCAAVTARKVIYFPSSLYCDSGDADDFDDVLMIMIVILSSSSSSSLAPPPPPPPGLHYHHRCTCNNSSIVTSQPPTVFCTGPHGEPTEGSG
jgi:hypothetical protein